jgi:hypothetical protein
MSIPGLSARDCADRLITDLWSECMFPDFRKTAGKAIRLGDDRRRMDQAPRGCGRHPLPESQPIEALRRILRSAALVGVLAIGGLVGFAATTTRAQSPKKGDTGTVTPEFRGRLDNQFTTVAPAPLLTLADSGSGRATVLGKVTDSFTVTIDFNQPVADGFVLVSKTSSLVADDGDRVDLAMVGTFNVTTFDVHYVFVMTGGTGRFADATGNGTWDVPPPAVFDPSTGSGSGAESFRGTITLPRPD